MPLEHAILGFLSYQPMSGYDLKKLFDQSVAHFWSATSSHIYKSLEGLEKKGWAEVKVIQQEDKPNRKEYHITAEGRAELHRWLVNPLPIEPVRKAWLIQIFFSHFSTNEEIISFLQSRMKQVQEHLQFLESSIHVGVDESAWSIDIERARQFWQLTLDYGIEYYKFELDWYEKTLKAIRKLPPPK
jgi:PadR family transcriptional regulator AphA